MGAGPVLPWHTLRPHPFPTPGRAWGAYVVCGCCRAGTTARAKALTQIAPNSSSLYTLFYYVIYNSVVWTLKLKTKGVSKLFVDMELDPGCPGFDLSRKGRGTFRATVSFFNKKKLHLKYWLLLLVFTFHSKHDLEIACHGIVIFHAKCLWI